MFKISSGFWVYLLTLFLLITFGFFLFFRFQNPLITYSELTKIAPKFIASQSNPCTLHINGGIPFSSPPDGNIQVNILCPNGQTSPNYLKLSALPNKTILDALNILSAVNNFSIKLNDQNKIEALGDIKNTSSQSWQVYLDNSKINNPLDKTFLKINQVLEIKYE